MGVILIVRFKTLESFFELAHETKVRTVREKVTLRATSSSEEKTDETAPKFCLTHDESAAMISNQAKLFEINM